MKPRDELVAIQKRLVNELKQRIAEYSENPDPGLARYLAEYQSEFSKGFERAASREEVIDQLMRANVAYFGDYHTLRTAQSAVISILRELVKNRKRKVVLGVEMFHAANNAHAQALIDERISAQEFRKAVRWYKSWGFPWQSFGRLFDFARAHAVPMFGLNINADDRVNNLAWRDEFAAKLIASLTQLYPDRLVAVLYGDLHIAQSHMPRLVDEELARFGVKRRQVQLFQNSEELYWQLVERKLEHVVDILKVRRDGYCILNATPLVKYQSFLNWQENSSELVFTGLEDLDLSSPGESTLLEEVVEFVRNIAAFLKVEIPDPAAFELATAADLDLLENLVAKGAYEPREVEALKDYMHLAETAFFVRANVLYLGNLSVSHAAEGAMKFILGVLRPMRVAAVEPRDDFYARILLEALAFFGSKVINARRKARTLAEWRELELESRGKRGLSEAQKTDREIARGYIAHAEHEEDLLLGRHSSVRVNKLYALKTAVHVGLTRAIGRTLGDLLFLAVNEERVPLESVRQAIFDDLFKGDVARNRYFQLVREASPQYASKSKPWTQHSDEEE